MISPTSPKYAGATTPGKVSFPSCSSTIPRSNKVIARLQLNYKDIPYKTEWIEYPDLAPKLKALGISPNTDENAEYTSPTVIFHGDNAGMMDSSKIAVEIEKRFPQKPVLVNTPMQTKVQQAFSKMFPALMPDIVPRVPRDLLNPPSEEYFRRTREARWGMTFTEKENQGGEKAWKEAEPALNELARLLQSNGGPFFEGSQGTVSCSKS